MLLEFRTDRRGYTMWLERDLFGAFVLHRRWYGLYNRRGGTKRQVPRRPPKVLHLWPPKLLHLTSGDLMH